MTKPPLVPELKEYIGDEFEKLSPANQEQLIKSYAKNRKNEVIYVFWFFNFHYAYVRKWWLFLLFLLSFGGIAIWWLIDLFRLPTILKEYNKEEAIELLKRLKNKDDRD